MRFYFLKTLLMFPHTFFHKGDKTPSILGHIYNLLYFTFSSFFIKRKAFNVLREQNHATLPPNIIKKLC